MATVFLPVLHFVEPKSYLSIGRKKTVGQIFAGAPDRGLVLKSDDKRAFWPILWLI
jgi:hypothetical protein